MVGVSPYGRLSVISKMTSDAANDTGDKELSGDNSLRVGGVPG